MLKKVLTIICCFAFIISLAGCKTVDTFSYLSSDISNSSKPTVTTSSNGTAESSQNNNTNSGETTSTFSSQIEIISSQEETVSSHDTTTSSTETESSVLPDFHDIECRKIESTQWQSARIKITKIKKMIQLDIPTEWTLKKSNDSIDILRNGKKIGFITTKNLNEPIDYYRINNTSNDLKEISVDWQVNLFDDNGYKFYHTMNVISDPLNETQPVNIQINYEELDDKSIKTLATSIFTVPADKWLNSYNTSNKILILGNSFIYTSQIGEFLEDFIKTSKKNYGVIATSIGNASASNFSENQKLYNEIADGEYAYIFQCGFYNDYNIEDFKVLETACRISNTPIAGFPAHNEQESVINRLKKDLSSAAILDWKGEINKLIRAGVDYYDFCIDDGPQHSKPLAGYVGAYTIFFNIFNETPPPLSSQAPLSMEYVQSKLGDNIKQIGFEGANLSKINSPKKLLVKVYTLD